MYASFRQIHNGKNDPCTIYCPDDVQVRPRETIKCAYSIEVHEVGNFQTMLSIVTKEKIYNVPVYGMGIRIDLSERSKLILEEEDLVNVILNSNIYRSN